MKFFKINNRLLYSEYYDRRYETYLYILYIYFYISFIEWSDKMPIPKKEGSTYKSRKSPNRKKSREAFAQELNKNLAKYSTFVMRPGGNVAVAVVNYDFCYELVALFIETITQFLLKNDAVFFDQFGKFEIHTQKSRIVNSPLTNRKNGFTRNKTY